MTITELLLTCRGAGIVLRPEGDALDVDAPAEALTPELREMLKTRKLGVLAVLVRLEAMRRTVGRVPVPCAIEEAVGGPGRWFSCGETLGRPDTYGRCTACDVACELFYRDCPVPAEDR